MKLTHNIFVPKTAVNNNVIKVGTEAKPFYPEKQTTEPKSQFGLDCPEFKPKSLPV